MIKKLLIANRGEIAVRIIRACKELGIDTVAVFSEADREALHVQMADEAFCIGPKLSKDSYLNITNIVSVAKMTGADAIHPGYGFLAENADFAELCEEVNVTFVGPTADAISKMGTKDVARETMQQAGVPIVPGSKGIIEDIEDAVSLARDIGYPVIIKATAGGGGKGIRVARTEEELINGIKITQQEAATAFGNPGVYIEKYIEDFRHVEIQVLADTHGNTIHLGERDCSIQRRLQKLLEETPSPALDEGIREQMGQAAVKAAEAVKYTGAGTVEFIYDYREQKFYFMEMNTRIQVEHPVTEMVTGVDLIKEQIRVASGEKLALTQDEVTFNGWAIECRINAENPEKNFMPSPGKIEMYLPPGGLGVRVDSAAYPGYSIPPYYDSMIAKVITYGKTREEAVSRMKRALSEFVIEGVHTTIPFHLKLLEHETFVSGEFNTKFLEIYDVMGS
ncbi:acetyl-CoA carboxylase biotin carboxylase subunit [Bacillus paralicheniformis]|mgnify:FL=1|jgi:acetyl-CoA carboxylase biotin carboxylase subunit|uniref:Biotin carboxylase n=1 Tax=Bacillus paralicheniformis TaxID=1648923 RepID=A0A6I7TZP6_9BACI|nr:MULTISPECIES: acetyl-CoA carboxylase biotin carboxylase subunit [Bacillus]ETB72671.1 acetyl-CoA carboxylase biotin carboxylase subunit [Bacillus sp. CPSM8]KJD53122.1 acetyl-CoA carboxylase [Bacillus amyloliquefaciens]KUL13443.1 acetyl-CoA carboxylase biotin carboxylase subunit [Bacillus licheniformis LMG 7559]KUL15793.1 acetyl-CoA carboxylase biotin carboxylase subunit [Bacillus licheniformis LMG 6934]MBC8624883.1 acetyl-CoA carboxylase biotin carboxylase subunit [Robertmurraya crescens]PO